jgi:predicted dehydrogenase
MGRDGSLSFGFIGCGKIAPYHADVVRALGHSVTAVAARPGSKRIKDFSTTYSAQPFDDWQQMLKAHRLDALLVLTPWNVTETLAVDVVSSGIPCLIEKPIAVSGRQIDAILDQLSGQTTDRVRVGYNRRFYENLDPLRVALRDQALRSVSVRLPDSTKHIENSTEALAEHVLFYMSSHWYDLLISLMGPLSVKSHYVGQRTKGSRVAGYQALLWSDKYQVPVHVDSNFDAPANIALSFTFETTIYELSPVERLTVYDALERIHDPKTQMNCYQPRVAHLYEADARYKAGFMGQMSEFVERCVKGNNTDAVQGCTLQQAGELTRFLEQLHISATPYAVHY